MLREYSLQSLYTPASAEDESSLIDTHSHLLPGVDHGCPDLDTSIRMARAAAESGVSLVVCTPHLHELVPDEVARVHQVAEQVRAALSEDGVALELEIRVGFEVDLEVALSCDPEEMRALAVEGTSGVLVLEMPYEGWPRFLEEALFRLAAAGFRPVLAHPERNDRVQASPDILSGCLRAGTVVQATVASITGEFGRAPERAFRKLLALGYVGLLASDAHAYRTDGWTLGPVLGQLKSTISEEGFRLLVEDNPRRLLAGQNMQKLRPNEGQNAPSRFTRALTVFNRMRRSSSRSSCSSSGPDRPCLRSRRRFCPRPARDQLCRAGP